MNRNLWFSLLFAAAIIIGGCDSDPSPMTQEEPLGIANIDSPTDESESAPSSDISFCGDVWPYEASSYPLNIYPLYIEQSSTSWALEAGPDPDLALVRQELCPSAYIGYIKGSFSETESYSGSAIIMGYFTDEARAQQALAMLTERLASLNTANLEAVSLGEPIPLEEPPPATETVARQAKLSSEQTQTLLALDQYHELGITFDVVVPTSLPQGFEVQSINVLERSAAGSSYLGPFYSITYQSPDQLCFNFSGRTGTGGAGAEVVEFAEANSHLLGQATLTYIAFVRERNKPFLSFKFFQIPTRWGGSQLYSLFDVNECQGTVSLTEAVTIVESLQYLNHPLNRLTQH